MLVKNEKKHMSEKRCYYGLTISLIDPTVIEMAAYAGYDFVRIDCEHSLFDHSLVANMIMVANHANIPIIIRIGTLDDIARILDFGASGIVIPSINNAEEAMNAVSLVKYAPLGSRGLYGSARYLKYGDISLKENVAKINEEVTLTIQIETKEGIKNIDDILSVKGIDMVATGRGDLSQSLGYIGEPNHEKVIEAEDYIIKKTLEYGKKPSILAFNSERVDLLKSRGVCYFSINRDTIAFYTAIKNHLDSFQEGKPI